VSVEKEMLAALFPRNVITMGLLQREQCSSLLNTAPTLIVLFCFLIFSTFAQNSSFSHGENMPTSTAKGYRVI
jgi:hypothetical protein